MSGLPAPNWARDDAETFGEGVGRCQRADCKAPLRMVVGLTVVVFRCDFGHVHELHSLAVKASLGDS